MTSSSLYSILACIFVDIVATIPTKGTQGHSPLSAEHMGTQASPHRLTLLRLPLCKDHGGMYGQARPELHSAAGVPIIPFVHDRPCATESHEGCYKSAQELYCRWSSGRFEVTGNDGVQRLLQDPWCAT